MMRKLKTSYYWYMVIFLIMTLLAFGYFFELGETFGTALAKRH
ncbi:hypothetical protein [Maribacter sp.]|nr:hypothetical protein [Maribacter sp.]